MSKYISSHLYFVLMINNCRSKTLFSNGKYTTIDCALIRTKADLTDL